MTLRKAIDFRDEGNVEKALEILEAAEKEFGEYTWIEDNKARCYWILGKFELAIATWENSIMLASISDPSEIQIIEDAVQRIRERKTDEIINDLESLVKYSNDDAKPKLEEHLNTLSQIAPNIENYKNQVAKLADFYSSKGQKNWNLFCGNGLLETV